MGDRCEFVGCKNQARWVAHKLYGKGGSIKTCHEHKPGNRPLPASIKLPRPFYRLEFIPRDWGDFQDSARYVADLSSDPNIPYAPKHGGRVYLDYLYIEDTQTWDRPSDKGRWYLLLGNMEYISDDLEYLESILYQWAADEEIG